MPFEPSGCKQGWKQNYISGICMLSFGSDVSWCEPDGEGKIETRSETKRSHLERMEMSLTAETPWNSWSYLFLSESPVIVLDMYSQNLQGNGRIFSCTAPMWDFRFPFVLNLYPQILQENDRFFFVHRTHVVQTRPETKSYFWHLYAFFWNSWSYLFLSESLVIVLNMYSQNLQGNGRIFLCTAQMWAFWFPFVLNVYSQFMQEKGRFFCAPHTHEPSGCKQGRKQNHISSICIMCHKFWCGP